MDFLKNNKLLNWGIFALVVLVLFYFFGTRSGKAKKAAATDGSYKAETAGKNLSYDLSQFATFADKLESAMFGFTDREETIYSVFTKLRTKSDLFQLITTFGTRRIIFSFGSADLPTWINTRLDQSEIHKINEILNRNNIDFQF